MESPDVNVQSTAGKTIEEKKEKKKSDLYAFSNVLRSYFTAKHQRGRWPHVRQVGVLESY